MLKTKPHLSSQVLQLVGSGSPGPTLTPASALVYTHCPLGIVNVECGFAFWALCLRPIGCDVCSLLMWYLHPSLPWICGDPS